MGAEFSSESPDPNLPSLFIVGPTAVGKSEIALLLAEKLCGEIISVDSMQVYRGLDIGTAKPSTSARDRISHHLIDVVDLDQHFDAAQFVELARRAVSGIQNRRRVPIFCGGTGLYFRAFLDGLGASPPPNPLLRAQLEATPHSDLLRELAERDRETYHRIDRENPRRVIRALEVIRLTNRPFSQQRAAWSVTSPDSEYLGRIIGFTRSPEDLRERINLRVDEMFRCGLVIEVQQLLKDGLAENRTAMQALGYRQVVEYLQGAYSLEATIELVKLRTRQFAKRQMTWFRRQLPVDWLALGPAQAPEIVAARLATTIFCRQKSPAKRGSHKSR